MRNKPAIYWLSRHVYVHDMQPLWNAPFTKRLSMRRNFIGLCLLATFIVIFGSILSMALFTSQEGPSAVSVEAVAKTPAE